MGWRVRTDHRQLVFWIVDSLCKFVHASRPANFLSCLGCASGSARMSGRVTRSAMKTRGAGTGMLLYNLDGVCSAC